MDNLVGILTNAAEELVGVMSVSGQQGPRGDAGPAGRDGVIQYTAGNNIEIDNNTISVSDEMIFEASEHHIDEYDEYDESRKISLSAENGLVSEYSFESSEVTSNSTTQIMAGLSTEMNSEDGITSRATIAPH